MNLDDLKKPFPPDRVSWRVGSTNKDKTKGMALAYIDARDVQDRLDEVCGPSGWQCRYAMAGGVTVCEIGIRINDEWVWKADGAGATDFEGEKGAMSDSFKRAAVKWGVGRYLYDVDAPWVAINEYKQIEKSELPKLAARLPGNAQRATAKPEFTSDPPKDASKRTLDDWKRILPQWKKNLDGINTVRALNDWIQMLDEGRELAALTDAWPAAADKFNGEVNMKRKIMAERETMMAGA